MRKIEQQIINALRNQDNFSSGNTKVTHFKDERGDITGSVSLHGNLVGMFTKATNQLILLDGGWQSRTTASRLNALLSEFAPAYRVVQRKHCWYIDDRSQDSETLEAWEGYELFRAGSKIN